MTAGDIKGDALIVIEVTYGASVGVGNVVHLESDGKWDPVADADLGKFGVALDAGGDGDTGKVVISGMMEVTSSGGAIPLGSCVMAGNGGTVTKSDHGTFGETVGTTLTAFDDSGNGTVYIGLVE